MESHHKYTIAVLKDETRELYGEAMSLSSITAPVVYEDEGITYRAWDHTISGLWDGYNKPVRTEIGRRCGIAAETPYILSSRKKSVKILPA